MLINDAIRTARSEHTVYFLLTAYLESLQFSRKLPEYVTVLPLAGLNDLEWRFEKLFAEFESTVGEKESNQMHDLLEAINVFEASVSRLCWLLTDEAHLPAHAPATAGAAYGNVLAA
jgi:hypothetical protein